MNMKKLLLLGSIVSLATAMSMSGCDGERIESLNGESDKVSFNTLVGNQTTTRAKEFGYWQAGQTLNVKAYETGTTDTTPYHEFNLTYNAPYTTSWTYSPLLEVPQFSLTYYTYYPETANISNMVADGTNATFSYTVPAVNEDLITAKTLSSSARVALMFHHVLSEVNFAIQELQGFKINISNIKLNAVANSGTYTFSPSGGTWSAVTGTADYPYTPMSGVTLPTDGTGNGILYFGNKGGNSPTDNDRTNALMLMPQTFASGSGAYISFDYMLWDANNQEYSSGSTRVYLGDFTSNKWEMGKRYLYLIDFTGLIEEGPITFEVIMFGWSDAMQEIAEPVIVAQVTKLLIEKAITTQNSEKATTPSLKVFPISLPVNKPLGANETIVLKDFTGDNFVTGDQIRIQCDTDWNAGRILLDDTLLNTVWTRSVGGSVVTLTKL